MKKPILTLAILIILAVAPVAIATIEWNDGVVHTISTDLPGSVRVDNLTDNDPGTHVDLVTTGSVEDDLFAYNNATVTMISGSIGGHLVAYGNASITMSGGSVGQYLVAHDDAIVTMSGGSVGWEFVVRNDGIIYLDGTGFEVTDLDDLTTSLSYGDKLSDFGTPDSYAYNGTITGTLANGDALNTGFRVETIGLLFRGTGDIIIIPEPCGLILLGLGGLVLRRRRG